MWWVLLVAILYMATGTLVFSVEHAGQRFDISGGILAMLCWPVLVADRFTKGEVARQ